MNYYVMKDIIFGICWAIGIFCFCYGICYKLIHKELLDKEYYELVQFQENFRLLQK